MSQWQRNRLLKCVCVCERERDWERDVYSNKNRQERKR